jgi:capsular polysaccharide biosynthesis protein/MinD-like ATPase involved in chromosome partitioning or flagellar assembly
MRVHDEGNPPLRQAARFIKQQAWLIVLVPALAIAVAALTVSRQQHVYRASMGIVVAQAGAPYVPPLGNVALSQTMTSIIESDVVARAVIQKLHLRGSPKDLLKNLRVAVKPDNGVLDVSYDSPNQRTALRVLSEVGKSFAKVARERLGVSTSLKKPGRLLLFASIIDPPHPHAGPVAPRPGKALGFAGGLGLALGLILAFARQSLDDRVREPRDAEQWFEAPLIGTLPPGFRARLKPDAHDQRRKNEKAVELLSANLKLASRTLGPAVLVTSTIEGRAGASVVAGLGIALARAGEKVVCVETDLRYGNLHHLFEQGNGTAERGLAAVLNGEIELDEALHEVDVKQPSRNGDKRAGSDGQLLLLPFGAPHPESTQFSSNRLSQLVAALSTRAGYVLFGSGPLLSSPEAQVLASAVNGVLVVARRGKTRREDAQATRVTLDQLGVRNVGVVLMNTRT